MSLLSQAYQDWYMSNEGQSSVEISILKDEGHLPYLQNRIFNSWHAGARAQEKLDRVEFVKREGLMADCLGVDDVLAQKMDEIVGRLIDAGKSQIEIVEQVRDQAGLNPSQFCAFMYSLGIYCGRKGL